MLRRLSCNNNNNNNKNNNDNNSNNNNNRYLEWLAKKNLQDVL